MADKMSICQHYGTDGDVLQTYQEISNEVLPDFACDVLRNSGCGVRPLAEFRFAIYGNVNDNFVQSGPL